ncbi:hypothetical protein Tco_0519003 [Tanacetum coccineum]
MFKGDCSGTPLRQNFNGHGYNCGGKGHYARNYPKQRVRDSKYFMEQMLLAKQDEAGGILTDEQNDFLFADASRMEEMFFFKELTIDDDKINSNIQFDSVKGNVNSCSVEKDTHVFDLCALETLARNAYDEAAKQQRFARKVDEKAKRFQKQADSQLYRDREIIRNLEKQQDELSQEVKHFKQKNEVWISQKSQENSQKRASTDTRIRRVQKEAKESKPKPEKSSLRSNQSNQGVTYPHSSSPHTSAMVKHTRDVGFALNSLTKKAQAVTSRNDSLAILECTI